MAKNVNVESKSGSDEIYRGAHKISRFFNKLPIHPYHNHRAL